MFTPIQIILVCAWMWGFTVIGMSVQLFSYGVAVLHGFVTGLIMGDVATGLTVGGTLCLMGLGVGGYGGSSVPDYAMGTVVGTVFAIATGGGVEAGLATGIPVATLGRSLISLRKCAVPSSFTNRWTALKNTSSIKWASGRTAGIFSALRSTRCRSYWL